MIETIRSVCDLPIHFHTHNTSSAQLATLNAMTARVYDHQIPGGQYSNMYAQCRSLGDADNWDAVLQMYHDVNVWCGDIVKVTPSSKSVGDIALFVLKQGCKGKD